MLLETKFKDLLIHSSLQMQEGGGRIIIRFVKVDRMDPGQRRFSLFSLKIEILLCDFRIFTFRVFTATPLGNSISCFLFPFDFIQWSFHPKNNGKHCFWHDNFSKRVTSPRRESLGALKIRLLSYQSVLFIIFFFFIFYCVPFITQRRRAWRNFTFAKRFEFSLSKTEGKTGFI